MGSRHSKPVTPRRRYAGLLAGSMGAVALVAMAAWAVVSLLTPTPARPVSQAAAQGTPINQDGRIIAVTDSSVTAMGADGVARTFVVTPDTTAVTATGGGGTAASSFAVNDEVSIVGEVRNGTAVATALAAHAVTNLNGPPMDYPAA